MTDSNGWPEDELERRIAEFGRRRRGGEEPRLEEYIDGAPLVEFGHLLAELLRVELTLRREAGQRPSTDEYLARFPDAKSLIHSVFSDTASADSHVNPASVGPVPLAPGQVFGSYTLTRRLGRGGMGDVFAARQARLDREVAIKFINPQLQSDPELRSRFEREARIVGNLDHPNLVRAYDAADINGWTFLVMELINGLDFGELLNRRARFAIPDACEVIRQAAMGLANAHLQSIVHRDVKPSNLMLTHDGTVKVLDLGLARPQGADEGLTVSGMMMGTADYIAPEQAESAAKVTGAADVYSLAATLFALLTGRPPYDTGVPTSMFEKVNAHRTKPVPRLTESLPQAPELLEKLMLKMMAKKPSARPTAADAAKWLARFTQGAKLVGLIPQPCDETTIPPKAAVTHAPAMEGERPGVPTIQGFKVPAEEPAIAAAMAPAAALSIATETPSPHLPSHPTQVPRRVRKRRRTKAPTGGKRRRAKEQRKPSLWLLLSACAGGFTLALFAFAVAGGNKPEGKLFASVPKSPSKAPQNDSKVNEQSKPQSSESTGQADQSPNDDRDAAAEHDADDTTDGRPASGTHAQENDIAPSPAPVEQQKLGATEPASGSETDSSPAQPEPGAIELSAETHKPEWTDAWNRVMRLEYLSRGASDPQRIGEGVSPIPMDATAEVIVDLPEEVFPYLVLVEPGGTIRPLFPWMNNDWNSDTRSQQPRDKLNMNFRLDKRGAPPPDPGARMLLLIVAREALPNSLGADLQRQMSGFPSQHVRDLAGAMFVNASLTAVADDSTQGRWSSAVGQTESRHSLKGFGQLLTEISKPQLRTFALVFDPYPPSHGKPGDRQLPGGPSGRRRGGRDGHPRPSGPGGPPPNLRKRPPPQGWR